MRATLVEWMGPQDANGGGFVHGGTIMKLCDEAAGLAAFRHCRMRCVTAGMDRMSFVSRVDIGEVVTLDATVNAVWRTSMEVGVRVTAENVRTGEVRHTSTAYLTMVAINDAGGPMPVPPLPPTDDPVALRRGREAQARRSNRLAEREAFQAPTSEDGEVADGGGGA
ncbi:acyl-CoA thioesterase [Conexibacter sp. W3-3-2]|uniref:acyl-CoA thioesterase n=1 Tax=Conexibacter sp. W3-3-2 TaxID=2675227 RepID=UPI0012B92531|nr:acyl-CoA thioesterase [Conexibacter sp. W3-3-2]MTD45169.1 acyl-CoA thioesterase [Conexibacter sp. W3-3-2]